MQNNVWRILLVDDDEDDYFLTREYLSETVRSKYQLYWSATYEDGLRAIQSDGYDAVLLDYDLGFHNGIEFLREVTAQGIQIPILILTGRGSYEVDLEAMEAGAVDYLSKQELSAALLERAVRYAIERSRTEGALAAANNELRQSRQQLSEIIESISDGFFVLDHDWRFLYINRRAAQNGGLEPGDLIGKVLWDVYPDLVDSSLARHYRSVMESRQPDHFEINGVYHEKWYDISVYPTVQGISVYWLDVTEKKQAEIDRERLVAELRVARQAAEHSMEDARQAAREARNSAAQREAILNNLTDGVVVFDKTGRVILANAFAVAMFGFEPVNMQQETIMRRLTITDPAGSMVPYEQMPSARAATGELVFNFPITVINRQGRTYSVLASALPMQIGSEFTGVVSVWNNITERERLEAENQRQVQENWRQSELLQTVHDAIIATDENFTITDWNPAAEKLYGWKAEEVIGKSWFDVLPSERSREERQAILIRAGAGAPYTGPIVHYTRDGRRLDIEGSIVSLRDQEGKLTGYVISNRDISEVRRMEARHLEHITQMEVHRRLLEHREMERQQIARDLHDGPIQNLLGLMFTLQTALPLATDPEQKQILTSVKEAAQRLVSELRSLCNALRPPTLVQFGLERALRNSAGELRERYPHLRIHMELTEDGRLLPDSIRLALYRIYQESLNNILRHANATEIAIRFGLDNGTITLEIQDNGRGFNLPGDWVRLAREGHLGLVGMKERVDAIGGALQVISEPHAGTIVRVTVPRPGDPTPETIRS